MVKLEAAGLPRMQANEDSYCNFLASSHANAQSSKISGIEVVCPDAAAIMLNLNRSIIPHSIHRKLSFLIGSVEVNRDAA